MPPAQKARDEKESHGSGSGSGSGSRMGSGSRTGMGSGSGSGSKALNASDLELRRVRHRELQLKRITGEISCAECRRLKLKCDKKVPCSSCIRRGCKHICPTGVNKDSNGWTSSHIVKEKSPSIGASGGEDDDTKQKLKAMSERIRMLEDALQIESGSHGPGGQRHPLLTPELLAVKQGWMASSKIPEDEEDEEDEWGGSGSGSGWREFGGGEGSAGGSGGRRRRRGGDVDAEIDGLRGSFGTLVIDDTNTTRFLGASAVEPALLMGIYDPTASDLKNNSEVISLPYEIKKLSSMWPCVPMSLSAETQAAQLLSFLPTYSRALSLVDLCFSNPSWFIPTTEKSEVIEDLFPIFYKEARVGGSGASSSTGTAAGATGANSKFGPGKMQDLALLFALFANGTLVDHSQPVVNTEGLKYHQLCRAALGVHPILEYASLSAIEALLQISIFVTRLCDKNFQEYAWGTVSLAINLASVMGLHRDSTRWKLATKVVEKRRRVFWEVFAQDKWSSMSTGRPPYFTTEMVDCEFPQDRGALMEDNGSVVESVLLWRYRFCRDVLSPLTVKLSSARPIKYSEIMDLDRSLQDFKVHPYAWSVPSRYKEILASNGNMYLNPHTCVWWKDITIMTLHQSYFARAMLEHSSDPIGSPYAASFLVTYRTALGLIKIIHRGYVNAPLILRRTWVAWARTLICAIIIGIVAVRSPGLSFAREAFKELGAAVELFEKADFHPVTRHGVTLLRRMYKKAAPLYGVVPDQDQDLNQESPETDQDQDFENQNRFQAPLAQERREGEIYLAEGGSVPPSSASTSTSSVSPSDERSGLGAGLGAGLPVIRSYLDNADEELMIMRGMTRFVRTGEAGEVGEGVSVSVSGEGMSVGVGVGMGVGGLGLGGGTLERSRERGGLRGGGGGGGGAGGAENAVLNLEGPVAKAVTDLIGALLGRGGDGNLNFSYNGGGTSYDVGNAASISGMSGIGGISGNGGAGAGVGALGEGERRLGVEEVLRYLGSVERRDLVGGSGGAGGEGRYRESFGVNPSQLGLGPGPGQVSGSGPGPGSGAGVGIGGMGSYMSSGPGFGPNFGVGVGIGEQQQQQQQQLQLQLEQQNQQQNQQQQLFGEGRNREGEGMYWVPADDSTMHVFGGVGVDLGLGLGVGTSSASSVSASVGPISSGGSGGSGAERRYISDIGGSGGLRQQGQERERRRGERGGVLMIEGSSGVGVESGAEGVFDASSTTAASNTTTGADIGVGAGAGAGADTGFGTAGVGAGAGGRGDMMDEDFFIQMDGFPRNDIWGSLLQQSMIQEEDGMSGMGMGVGAGMDFGSWWER